MFAELVCKVYSVSHKSVSIFKAIKHIQHYWRSLNKLVILQKGGVMSKVIVKNEKKKSNKKNVVISKNIKNHEKDPFFVKKAREAEAFLNKHGLPSVFAK